MSHRPSPASCRTSRPGHNPAASSGSCGIHPADHAARSPLLWPSKLVTFGRGRPDGGWLRFDPLGELMSTNATVEKLVSLCKRRGFIFQSSEIYGGIGGFWDYGPLGVELKSNVKGAWWKAIVQERDDMVGLDAAILMNPSVWEASGHVDTLRRPDGGLQGAASAASAPTSSHGTGQRPRPRARPVIRCPECGGELTEARMFNLMFKTFVGPGGGRRRGGLPAAGDGAGHLRQLRERARRRRAGSCPSASPRSASRSATRSRPATSSSATASSSRWRSSTSSSRARTRSGTSTGWRSGSTGT